MNYKLVNARIVYILSYLIIIRCPRSRDIASKNLFYYRVSFAVVDIASSLALVDLVITIFYFDNFLLIMPAYSLNL